MPTGLDYYNILGVHSASSSEEIKTAYRRLVRRLHPDTNPNHRGANWQFQTITEAYNVINDPIYRRQYDDLVQMRKKTAPMLFQMRQMSSRQVVLRLPDPQVIYMLSEITPDPRVQLDESARQNSPLNLTLVLDHSNSMNGVRLDKVKIAAQQIIDTLNEKDVLSVVAFNDRAEVIISSTPVSDKTGLKARMTMLSAWGGTEIFQGLSAGLAQNRTYLSAKRVNHIVLLTDGHTFGDQEQCLSLARQCQKEGIGISAMGLGHDWNDEFLDKLASLTGGASVYIESANSVARFMSGHVRQLSGAFAERVGISVAPDSDIQFELAFKLAPSPQPLSTDEGDGNIPLGGLHTKRPISVLLQLQLPPNMPLGFRSVARLCITGDILSNEPQQFQTVSDISIEVVAEQHSIEEPPPAIMDALSKLTLYRMQERAREALDSGDVAEATRRLETLATRLLEAGEEELAKQALAEARLVAHTHTLSDKGRKTLKFQTRHLMLGAGDTLP